MLRVHINIKSPAAPLAVVSRDVMAPRPKELIEYLRFPTFMKGPSPQTLIAVATAPIPPPAKRESELVFLHRHDPHVDIHEESLNMLLPQSKYNIA
jgi:hypothetical protein